MKPSERFSNVVDNYLKYRPKYPSAIIDFLKNEKILHDNSIIADLGSGTGFLTELFLANGNKVFGIEPNTEMRRAGEQYLAEYKEFVSLPSTAESTGLADSSIDLITAGQALHWFDLSSAKKEFARILKPAGWAVLIWNDRKSGFSPFLAEYERILKKYAHDYDKVNHRNITRERIDNFFAPNQCKAKEFPNEQVFDWTGLKGRLLSSSYAPQAGHPDHTALLNELRTIFETYQTAQTVSFEYDTKVYYGMLSKG